MNPNHKKFLASYGDDDYLYRSVSDTDLSVRSGAAKNPGATKEHLDKLVNDDEWAVRAAVAKHPVATKEHLDRLVNDESWAVKEESKSELIRRGYK